MAKDYSEATLDRFFDHILEVLKSRPKGLTEYELMEELEEHHLPFLEDRKTSDLGLFRSHFILFHILYRLRDRLLNEGSYRLSIFCLEIKLTAIETGKSEMRTKSGKTTMPEELYPTESDPVREYYLDLSNMEGVGEEEVRNMLRGFFRRLEAFYRQEEDLAVLGLSPSATLEDIRKRYRILAFQHHPDQGGNPEDFRIIEEAAGRLKSMENL